MGLIETSKERAEFATSRSLHTGTATVRAKFHAIPIKYLTMLFHAGLSIPNNRHHH